VYYCPSLMSVCDLSVGPGVTYVALDASQCAEMKLAHTGMYRYCIVIYSNGKIIAHFILFTHLN
jgi:hypothetical protein